MMISIAEAISDLLFVRDSVVVPGLGAFVKKSTSAKVNSETDYFTMPGCIIDFDPNIREDNDLVVNYMVKESGISLEEAKKLLAAFVSDSFNSLKQGKKVVLNRIGTLSNDWAGDLVFMQDNTVNYNADAFGLSDFTLELVLKEEEKEDENMPIAEDDEEDEPWEPRPVWPWIVLGVLLLAGIVFGLNYMNFIDVKSWFGKPKKGYIYYIKPGTYKLPAYAPDWDEELAKYKETLKSAESVEATEANIRIIAGCFDQEEYAARLTNSLKNKGYNEAFYEVLHNKWYVSFGRYRTEEEATVALRAIRANTEYKAWIMK